MIRTGLIVLRQTVRFEFLYNQLIEQMLQFHPRLSRVDHIGLNLEPSLFAHKACKACKPKCGSAHRTGSCVKEFLLRQTHHHYSSNESCDGEFPKWKFSYRFQVANLLSVQMGEAVLLNLPRCLGCRPLSGPRRSSP